MSTKEIQVRIEPQLASFYTKVAIYDVLPSAKVDLNLGRGETKLLDPLGLADPSDFTFMATDNELRELYQALKAYLRIGTDQTYVDGKLEQTEKHLNDMRVIALSGLKLDKHI